MPEGKTFGSFAELANQSRTEARVEKIKQGIRTNTTPTRDSNLELFREILEGNFADVPPGEFIVDQPGIETVSIGRIGNINNDPEQLFATFFYKNSSGKQASFSWSIGQDGTFSGDIPKEISADREQLKHTILDVLDKVGVGFWRMKDDEFLGQTDQGKPRTEGEEDGDVETRPHGNDPERLEFLRQLPGVIDGYVSGKLGFNGYHAAVLPDRIILEHPTISRNAIFVVYLDQNILADEALAERDIQRRLTKEESDLVYDKYWKPIGELSQTKKQLRALPDAIPGMTVRKIKHGGKDWKARLAAAAVEPAPKKE